MEFRPVCTMHAGKLCRFTCDQILEDGANTLTTTTHPSWLQVHSTVGSCTVLMPFRSGSIFYWPQAYVTVPQVQIFFVLLHKKRFLKDFAASVLELVAHCISFTHVKWFVQNRRQHPYCCNYNNYGISTDGLQQSTAVKLHWFNMSLLDI